MHGRRLGWGMSVRRVMGTEIEYGISVPGQPAANPMTAVEPGRQRLGARPRRRRRGRPRWDFEEESPLRDARGLRPARRRRRWTDNDLDEDTGLANVILTNGARLYVDHAHPEYSTPEVTNPRDVVLWDKAGERVMAEAARRAAARARAPSRSTSTRTTPTTRAPRYGAHENYLMARQTPFADIVRGLTPFFVTRQVFAAPAGSASARTAARRASSSPSAPTSSRSRSAWRRRSSGRSSTPATSRTPTPTSTAGCT